MGRPKLYRERLQLLVSSEATRRMEAVRELRRVRLGIEPTAADIYREALGTGLAVLEDAERAIAPPPPAPKLRRGAKAS